MPHWNVKLAAAIRKLQTGNPPWSAWTLLAKLADELCPPKIEEAPAPWKSVPLRKPKPPDEWEFVRDDKGKRVKRAPKKGEWLVAFTNKALALQASKDYNSNATRHILRRIPNPQGWLDEFYSERACDVPAERALEHGLRKWIGARKENLERYGLCLRKEEHDYWGVRVPGTDTEILLFNTDTCALCSHHRDTCSRPHCPACPLRLATPKACNVTGPWGHFIDHGDPEPMIAALEQAIRERDAKKASVRETTEMAERLEQSRKPQPGEFVETSGGSVCECVGPEKYCPPKGHGPPPDDAVCLRYCNGQVSWAHLRYVAPWTPRAGEEVWGKAKGKWQRVRVDKWHAGDRVFVVATNGKRYCLIMGELRPLAFPPDGCCSTCGAKR